jgi:amino-acid N-acetyltransferase
MSKAEDVTSMTTEPKKQCCVTLRAASASDLPKILALLSRAGLPTQGVDSHVLPDFVIAEDDGTLVGVVGLEVYRDSALLRSAAVEEGWRGSGVGRALIDRALALSHERGIRDVFLLTTTAEHYFPRFGFACIGRESVPEAVQTSIEFQGACPSTAVIMRRSVRE